MPEQGSVRSRGGRLRLGFIAIAVSARMADTGALDFLTNWAAFEFPQRKKMDEVSYKCEALARSGEIPRLRFSFIRASISRHPPRLFAGSYRRCCKSFGSIIARNGCRAWWMFAHLGPPARPEMRKIWFAEPGLRADKSRPEPDRKKLNVCLMPEFIFRGINHGGTSPRIIYYQFPILLSPSALRKKKASDNISQINMINK